MSGSSWQFWTAGGVVTVEDDAIVRRSTPALVLAGLRTRWRYGDHGERASIAFQAFGVVFSLFGLFYHASIVADDGLGLSSVLYGVSVALFAYSVWRQHLAETRIRRSAVERVTLDDDARSITIAHEADGGALSAFRDDETETTLTFGSADDLRKAREICRLRGIDLAPAPAEPRDGETTYRFFTRGGACFCERCRSQVSPADGTCPACDYALRVETERAA